MGFGIFQIKLDEIEKLIIKLIVVFGYLLLSQNCGYVFFVTRVFLVSSLLYSVPKSGSTFFMVQTKALEH